MDKNSNSPPPYSSIPPQGYQPTGPYAPPTGQYVSPPSGYPSPLGYGSAPPSDHCPPTRGHNHHSSTPLMHKQQTNVVVLRETPANRTVIINERDPVNHSLHCCISFFFPPWVIVWISLCMCYGC